MINKRIKFIRQEQYQTILRYIQFKLKTLNFLYINEFSLQTHSIEINYIIAFQNKVHKMFFQIITTKMNQTQAKLKLLVLLFIFVSYVKNSMTSKINIDLQSKIDPFLQIGTISFSQKQIQIMYVSAEWLDTTKSVKKYNISNNQFLLLTTYTNSNQALIYDRILEVDSSIFVIYKYAGNNIEFFYKNNSTFKVGGYTYPIDKIIYSPLYQTAYLMMNSGIVFYSPYSIFITADFSTMSALANINQQGNIQMSLDQNFLAIGTTSAGSLLLFNLISNALFYSSTFANLDTLKFSWKNDNQTLYLMDATTLKVTQINVLTEIFITINTAIISNSYGYSLKYLQQTNQLLIVASSLLNNTFYTLVYNVSGSFVFYSSDFNPSNKQSIGNTYYNSYYQTYMFSYYNVSQGCLNTFLNVNSTLFPSIVPNITNQKILPNTTNSNNGFINSEMTVMFQMFSHLSASSLNSSALKGANKMPGSRRILKPFLAYLANFDDLILYNYHSKANDVVISDFLTILAQIQNQKVKTNPFKNIQTQYQGSEVNSTYQTLNYKLNYTSARFIEVQGNANGLFQNTFDFWTIDLLLLFLTYFICRSLFSLLFSYKVSTFFRQYSFFIIVVMMILDGNLQFMMYLAAFQLKTLFFNTFNHKYLAAFTLILVFAIIYCAVGVIWMIRYFCYKKQKYLYQNIKGNLYGTWFLCFQFGIRNIILGFLHFFLLYDDQSKNLAILLIFQLLFLILNIFLVLSTRQYLLQSKLRHWISMVGKILRITQIVIFIFSVQTDKLNSQSYNQIIFNQFTITNVLIFVLNLTLMSISIIYELIIKAIQVKALFKHNQQISRIYLQQIKLKQKHEISSKIKKIIKMFKQNMKNAKLIYIKPQLIVKPQLNINIKDADIYKKRQGQKKLQIIPRILHKNIKMYDNCKYKLRQSQQNTIISQKKQHRPSIYLQYKRNIQNLSIKNNIKHIQQYIEVMNLDVNDKESHTKKVQRYKSSTFESKMQSHLGQYDSTSFKQTMEEKQSQKAQISNKMPQSILKVKYKVSKFKN